MNVKVISNQIDISDASTSKLYAFEVHGLVGECSLQEAVGFVQNMPMALQASVMALALQGAGAMQLPLPTPEPAKPSPIKRGTFVMTEMGWAGIVHRDDGNGDVEVYRRSSDTLQTISSRDITATAKIVLEGSESLKELFELPITSLTELWNRATTDGIRTGQNTWTITRAMFPDPTLVEAIAKGQEMLEQAAMLTDEELQTLLGGDRATAIQMVRARLPDLSLGEAKDLLDAALEKQKFDQAVADERERVKEQRAAEPKKKVRGLDQTASFIGMVVTYQEPGDRPRAGEVVAEDDEEVEMNDLGSEATWMVERRHLIAADKLIAGAGEDIGSVLEDYIDRSKRTGKTPSWSNLIAAVRSAEAAKILSTENGAAVIDEDIVDNAIDIGRKTT